MKCQHCETTTRTLSFAFKDNHVIYGCSKHRGDIKKDALTDWIVLPGIERVKENGKC